MGQSLTADGVTDLLAKFSVKKSLHILSRWVCEWKNYESPLMEDSVRLPSKVQPAEMSQ